MKYLLPALVFIGFQTAKGQDSVRVTFGEEPENLFVKQRFVDRYENVFMTKIPTRHMLKVGLTTIPRYIFTVENTPSHTSQIDLGYEYKMLPSWSVGMEAGISGLGAASYKGPFTTVSGKVYGRWYYDMHRRISEGTNSNNFTGNFLAVVGEQHWEKDVVESRLKRLGLEFGLQRRFLNQGRLELGIGVFYQHYRSDRSLNFVLNPYEVSKSSPIAIASRTSMGLAFGDWKRQKNQPFCEVLRCDERVGQLWKLQWPTVYISSAYSNGTIGLGFEKKLKSSPYSVNTQVSADYVRVATRYVQEPPVFPVPATLPASGTRITANDFRFQSTVQLRYYVNQKRNIRRGTGGNNLSGLYAAPYAHYLFYHSETYSDARYIKRHLGLGAAAGFQQVMFGKVFIDFSAGASRNVLKINENSRSYLAHVRLGFGLVF